MTSDPLIFLVCWKNCIFYVNTYFLKEKVSEAADLLICVGVGTQIVVLLKLLIN
jgi:hypothetical protein